MRLAIISDIHSNLEALDAVISDIRSRRADRIVCLGDIVGYGADPEACIGMVRTNAEFAVLGNHDWAIVHREDPGWRRRFNPMAVEVATWTAEKLSAEDLGYLSALPLKVSRDNMMFVHSAPRNPTEWDYVFTAFEARHYTKHFTERLCFIGHSHVPGVYSLDADVNGYSPVGRCIINVGSVGQPRDGDWRASYGLLDTVAGTYDNLRIEYDVDAAMKKILQAGLPLNLAKRLKKGV